MEGGGPDAVTPIDVGRGPTQNHMMPQGRAGTRGGAGRDNVCGERWRGAAGHHAVGAILRDRMADAILGLNRGGMIELGKWA